MFSFFFSEIRNFELHLSRTAWQILVIHISFFSIVKALSNESRLYFGCSSPFNEKQRQPDPQNSRFLYLCSTVHYLFVNMSHGSRQTNAF